MSLRSVLVVDDEAEITNALKDGLERRGFKVETFNDPEEAIRRFKPRAYDVAILDIRMPKMNGFELYRRMRGVDQNAVVCFLTAFDVRRDEFEKIFPDLDVGAFLRKPVAMDDLATKLNELVS